MSNSNTKTNHQTGWHKPVVNPTANYPKDSHKAFCKRCLSYNETFARLQERRSCQRAVISKLHSEG